MITELNDDNFDSEVIKANGLVLVDFWAVWCSPCRALAPIVEAAATEFEGKLKVCKYDVEGGTEVAANYGIRNIPTLLFFKDGQLVDKSTGLISKVVLAEKINGLL